MPRSSFRLVLATMVALGITASMGRCDETIEPPAMIDYTAICKEMKTCKTFDEIMALAKCPPGFYASTKDLLWPPLGGGPMGVKSYFWVNDKSVLMVHTSGDGQIIAVKTGQVHLHPFSKQKQK